MKTKIILLLLAAAIIYSCGKNNIKHEAATTEDGKGGNGKLNSAGIKEGESEFTVSYPEPRRIYRIDKEDLNNDGNKEIIVLSVAKDTGEQYNDYYNFDRMEIFVLNRQEKKYVKILSDTVDYAVSCDFVKLGRDSSEQILIKTNLGGNNDIVSRGLFVYDMSAPDKISLLKYIDSGSPEIADLKNDGNNEILVSDLYYGIMPQINAINFVKEIYKFENNKLVIRNKEFENFYDDKIKGLLENYYGLKRKVEMGMQPVNLAYPLYREAAEVMVNYLAKGDTLDLKKFWDEEKQSLKKNIPQEEYTDLNNFILKVLPSAKNA